MKETEKEIGKVTKERTECNSKIQKNRKYSTGSNCIYGLGLIGAAVFFIDKATSFGEGIMGFLKALVWPAIMVYEVFKYLIK